MIKVNMEICTQEFMVPQVCTYTGQLGRQLSSLKPLNSGYRIPGNFEEINFSCFCGSATRYA